MSNFNDPATFAPLVPKPDLSQWRHSGHQFDALPESVQGDVRGQIRIPIVYSMILLPELKLSVLDFISTSLPPVCQSEADYPTLASNYEFFSNEIADPDTMELLSRTLVPPRRLIIQLLPQAKQRWLDGAESIRVPNEATPLPLWVLQFWSDLHLTIEPPRLAWQNAIDWLTSENLSSHAVEVQDTLNILSTLSWSGEISFTGDGRHSFPKITLARFLSREWLGDEQIDQMLYLLKKELTEALPSRNIHIVDTILTRVLIQAYLDDTSGKKPYDPSADTFLPRFGSTLTSSSEFGGMFHVRGNHWVSGAVDMIREALVYGDPTGDPADEDVVNALRWFISKHLALPITFLDLEAMPCPTQSVFEDWWSCGVFGHSGLSHFYRPDVPMVGSTHADTDLARMSLLRKIVTDFNSKVFHYLFLGYPSH